MIIFLGGDNDFAILRHITKLRQQYAKKYRDGLDEVTVDIAQDGITLLEQSLLALPMFYPYRLVIIRGIAVLKDEISRLDELFRKVPDSTVAVIDGRGLDKRTKLYKTLVQLPKAKIFASHTPGQRVRWICDEAKRNGVSIAPKEAQYLLQRVGEDEWLLAGSLAKMSLATAVITPEIIDEHTPKSIYDTVFDLIEQVDKGDVEGAITVYEQLVASGTNDQQLISTLMWHYRVLALALDGADDDALGTCGVKPSSFQRAITRVQSLSHNDVGHAYEVLLDADISIKTGEKKPHQAMMDLIIQLADR